MSKKQKLLERLRQRPKDFTWEEAKTLMESCGFVLLKNSGSSRTFRHSTGVKVRLHEPHPQPVLKRYALDLLLEGVDNAGDNE